MPGEGKYDDSSDDEAKGGEGKGGGGSSRRRLDARATDDDFDGSSNDPADVRAIRLGETCIVQRSDNSWRYAILDGVEEDKLEFQVGETENDYKLFSPEEFSKIRRLDCGASGHK